MHCTVEMRLESIISRFYVFVFVSFILFVASCVRNDQQSIDVRACYSIIKIDYFSLLQVDCFT